MSWQDISSGDENIEVYLSQYDSLVVFDDNLYREWISSKFKTKVLQLVVPRNYVNTVLEEAHDSPFGGQFSVNKTFQKICKRFCWASCKKDFENWYRSCSVCIAKKGPSDKGHNQMRIYNVGLPFERVQMDILGPFPIYSLGNRYLLVVTDCFTKCVEAFHLSNMIQRLLLRYLFVKSYVDMEFLWKFTHIKVVILTPN